MESTMIRNLVASVLLLFAILRRSSADLPQITGEIKSLVNAREGQRVSIICPVGPRDLFVTWKKGQEEVTEGWPRFSIKSANSYELIISAAKISDSGIYSCEAVSGYGALDPLSFTLKVYDVNATIPTAPAELPAESRAEKPTFLDSPPGESEVRAKEGDSVTLKCRATGRPAVLFAWLFNNQLVQDVEGWNAASRDSLRLRNLRKDQSGQYTCQVSNSAGFITYTYWVTVEHAPDPLLFPLNTSVNYGATASLQCRVRSAVQPRITWLKEVPASRNDSSMVAGKHYLVVSNETDGVETEPGSYLNKLVIPNAKPEHSGLYICMGTAGLGGVNIREAYLIVRQDPNLLTTVRVGQDASWEYIFGSPSATLAVMIAIPVVVLLLVIITVIYCLNKRKTTARKPAASTKFGHDREASVPLNMNSNNGCTNTPYGNGFKKVMASGDNHYHEKLYKAPSSHKSQPLQQFCTYAQSDGSYHSSVHYPHTQQNYAPDINDSDSHFSSVSHSRPQFMHGTRHLYEREAVSDPSRSSHIYPPAPPASYYSGQW